MSFTNQTLKSGPYDCNGSVVAFTGDFHCLDDDHFSVILTDSDGLEVTLTKTTDYTITGTFPTDSFTVTTVSAYASGNTITIARNTPLTQESSFGNSGPYLPAVHEDAFDKSMVAIQEIKEEIDRCVKNDVSATAVVDSESYLAACQLAASQAAASAATVTQSATRTVALRATGNVDLSTALVAGQSIDGVVLVAGDRVLCDQQSTAAEDGVYVSVAAGAGDRASDWAVGSGVSGRLVTVPEGTANGGFIFLVENADGADVVGTDGLTMGVQLKTISADDKHLVRRSGAVVEEDITAFAATMLDDAAASDVRTTLGLGTIATQDSDSVSITGGTITGADLSGSGAPTTNDLYHIVDEKTSGSGGGTGTGATWNTRTLNTARTATISGASVSSSVITLPAGTYWVEASAPVHSNGNGIIAKLRLRQTSVTAATLLLGDQSRVDGDGVTNVRMTDKMHLSGAFTLADTEDIELQQYISTTDTNTLGYPASTGENEVYAEIKIWKTA